MNLEDLTVTGTNQVHVTDSLNSALMKLSVKRNEDASNVDTNDLIVYVDKQDSSNPTSERKQYVFELSNPLQYFNDISDEFLLQLKIVNNDVKFVAQVERKLSVYGNVVDILSESEFEELDAFPVSLFEGENYIYTNYTDATISIIYPKNNDINKMYLNNAIFGGHRLNATGDFGLDDIYFKDAFTKTGEELNLEVDNAEVKCLSSKNNKFSLDENGNLIVNSILTNSGLDINNQSICNLIYPVGSIYMSINATNPSALFGGTWEQLQDRFLLGSGSTYVNGTTGGEATHTLTIAEMPNHGHKNFLYSSPGGTNFTAGSGGGGSTAESRFLQPTTGGDQPHNNMPPYLVVNMWKRTA